MTSHDTRAYMGDDGHRPASRTAAHPTDQGWIESFFGHVVHEWPHLDAITDPVLLESELARVRIDYNEVRLHEAIGDVTPDDEHHGRGEATREARRQGLQRAREAARTEAPGHHHNPEETA
jgi:transposase InsO family protein